MSKTKLIVDGHVHFYSCYDPDKFFDVAIKNIDITTGYVFYKIL